MKIKALLITSVLVAFLGLFPKATASVFVLDDLLSATPPVGSVSVEYEEFGSTFRVEGALAPGEVLTGIWFSPPDGTEFLQPPTVVGAVGPITVSQGVFILPGGVVHTHQIQFSIAGVGGDLFDGQDSAQWSLDFHILPIGGGSGILPITPAKEWPFVGYVQQGIGPDCKGDFIGYHVPEPRHFAVLFAVGLTGFAGMCQHQRRR
jgi:hypothetical protein